MNKYQVEIIGGKPPNRPEGALKRIYRRIRAAVVAVLLRPWAIALAALAGVVLFVGTPHVGWEYQCSHATRGFGTCRSVSWCAYYGIQGRRQERPEYGHSCKLVTVLPLDWGKVLGGVMR